MTTTQKPLRNGRNDAIAVARLTKLVTKLKKVKPEKFIMGSWSENMNSFSPKEICNLHACGTTGCALGWATEI